MDGAEIGRPRPEHIGAKDLTQNGHHAFHLGPETLGLEDVLHLGFDEQDGRAGEEGLVRGEVFGDVRVAGTHPRAEEDEFGWGTLVACGSSCCCCWG